MASIKRKIARSKETRARLKVASADRWKAWAAELPSRRRKARDYYVIRLLKPILKG